MRQASWIAVALVLSLGTSAGCGKKRAAPPPPPPAPIDAAPRPIDGALPTVDAPPPPLTPPPGARGIQIIDLQYGGFAQPGLPAIKDDGSEIVATSVADDGGRGYLDLTVILLDGATGRPRTTLSLADANETSATEEASDAAGNFGPEDALAVKVRERVAQANAWVTTGTWRTLTGTLRDPESGPPAPKESLVAGDLTFTYDLTTQTLELTRAGKRVASHRLSKFCPRPSGPARPTARARATSTTSRPCIPTPPASAC